MTKTDPNRPFEVNVLQRLLLVKRVFRLNINTCQHCGGTVKVIAGIEDSVVIKRVLDLLGRGAGQQRWPWGRQSGRYSK